MGVDFLDKDKLKKRNISISNSPGCNKEAVAEWFVGMLLMYFRKLSELNRAKDLPKEKILKTTSGLYNKKIAILGAGNIGKRLGKICKSLGMEVVFFKRGDDLTTTTKDADIIANCLSANPTTVNLLGKSFFDSLKKGAFFISAARNKTYDLESLKGALDKRILIGAADDTSDDIVGDTRGENYKRLISHPKILVTPHIAWNSEAELRKSNDMMIKNIEAWIKGSPINLI